MNVQEFVMYGHAVFPCEGKRPVKGWKWGEKVIDSHEAPELADHEEWAWPTKRPLIVYDIDRPDLWPYDDPEQLLKTHAGQRTPSGGYHLVMVDTDPEPRQPAQIREPWGEIRREGTYHRLYEPNRNWLQKDYLPVPDGWQTGVRKREAPDPVARSGAGEPQAAALHGGQLVVTPDITAPAEEGSRNIRLTSYVGALHKRGTPWLEMVEKAQELNATYQPPLDDEEVLAICRSVARYPAGTPQPEFPASSRPADNSTGQTGRAGSVEFLSASEVQAGDFPQPEMWLDCWGPEQAVMLHGPSGSGKSLFMLDRLLRMRQVKTLVIDAEMPMSTIKKRLGRVQAPNLYWLQKEYIHEWGNLDLSSWSHVVLDTKAALYSHAESENSMEHWAPLNKWLRHWCDQGVCVSLLHHSNADASKARGSTNAITAMDSELSIRGFEVGNTKYWTVKQQKDRHGLLLPQRWFTLHQAEAQNMVFGEVENPEI